MEKHGLTLDADVVKRALVSEIEVRFFHGMELPSETSVSHVGDGGFVHRPGTWGCTGVALVPSEADPCVLNLRFVYGAPWLKDGCGATDVPLAKLSIEALSTIRENMGKKESASCNVETSSVNERDGHSARVVIFFSRRK